MAQSATGMPSATSRSSCGARGARCLMSLGRELAEVGTADQLGQVIEGVTGGHKVRPISAWGRGCVETPAVGNPARQFAWDGSRHAGGRTPRRSIDQARVEFCAGYLSRCVFTQPRSVAALTPVFASARQAKMSMLNRLKSSRVIAMSPSAPLPLATGSGPWSTPVAFVGSVKIRPDPERALKGARMGPSSGIWGQGWGDQMPRLADPKAAIRPRVIRKAGAKRSRARSKRMKVMGHT